MNREEAINKLNWALDNNMIEDVQSAYDYIMAIKMAIKALEQEPCEDAISRQAVLDLAKKGVLVSNGNYKSVCKAINELPPVNPQPKIGHWIEVTNGRGGHECDLCHNYAPSYQNGDEYLTKYCPNCAAKMVEPQENERINCKSTKCENCINHSYCDYEPQESDHKCHTCKHYTSGERDGSCDSYICEYYSDWESEE